VRFSGSSGLRVGALALSLVPAGAAGQTVVGRVIEEGVSRPLGGAFVVLEDAAGARREAVLADDDGRFVLRAPSAGRYRLVARRIGYEDVASEAFVLAEGETVERILAVRVRAIDLEGIRAEVGRRCRRRPETDTQTARLWEEARKALEITDWAEAEQALRFHIIRYRRELDAATLRVTATEETGRRGTYDRSPYRSIAAERLESGGYIQPASRRGQWDHFAPDAEVLLSESFLDTHCFRVDPDGSEDRVGLAFEPVTGRSVPDIEGVLWLDRRSAELDRLEFRYVGLPYPHGDWPQVGGRVEFERLATGMWVVRRWHIRMPLSAERTGGYGNDPQRLRLRSLVEDGAEVVQVRTRSGEVLIGTRR
jgi:hypothetical protein